jgi:hypothetical protein
MSAAEQQNEGEGEIYYYKTKRFSLFFDTDYQVASISTNNPLESVQNT